MMVFDVLFTDRAFEPSILHAVNDVELASYDKNFSNYDRY